MSVTITSSAGDVATPTIALAYAWTRTGMNSRHDAYGAAFPDVTLRIASSRRGKLGLVFPVRADAIAAEAMHAKAATFALVDTDIPEASMTYAVDEAGSIALELDEATLRVWVLTIDFAQVG